PRPQPVPAEAEHGRGLCLIEQLADHVHIGNKPGRGGAVVSFDKILKWREDAPLTAV
ncbi:ATP-binding protein, partial [Streptomyces sp. Z38]|nr:ATP-binding protein [Streptomyces sp. Z38]